MWQPMIGNSLLLILVTAVPTLLIAAWVAVGRRTVKAFNDGRVARDVEVAALTAEVAATTSSLMSLERRFADADAESWRLQAEFVEAQKELARLQEKAARIPEIEKALLAAEQRVEALRQELAAARQSERLVEQELENERNLASEKIKLLIDAKVELSQQFKALAGEVLDQKSAKFTELNQTHIKGLIDPLKEQLDKFDKRIVDARSEDAKERQQVRSELKQIQELGLQLSTNANNLTRALKGDAKAQGTWGEMILETVLEKSGLEKGREYDVQDTKQTEGGKRVRPDVLVHLPENKVIVIDSKVSLTAYERAINAETEEQRAEALSQHVISIRNHIAALGEKNYQDLLGHASLDFVLVFVPNEPALTLALSQAPDLFDLAMERNIGLVSPSLLMVTLRMIESLWRTERQNQNALEIAKQAGALYDKFVAFVEALESVGTRLQQAQGAYQDAHKRLMSGTGNLVSRTERLRKLGANASKSLPRAIVAIANDEPEGLTDGPDELAATGSD